MLLSCGFFLVFGVRQLEFELSDRASSEMDIEASSTAKKRRKPDHISPEVVSKPVNVCGHCSKKCTSKGLTSEAIMCDLCGSWVHAACEGLTREQFKVFNQLSNSVENIVYYCNLNQCLVRYKQLVFQQLSGCFDQNTSAKPWLEEYKKLNDHVTALSEKIDTLCSSNTNLQQQIHASHESLSLTNQSNTSPASSTSASSQLADAMNDYFDKERRRQNLIIYGLPESNDSNSANRNAADIASFGRLVSSQFRIEISALLRLLVWAN